MLGISIGFGIFGLSLLGLAQAAPVIPSQILPTGQSITPLAAPHARFERLQLGSGPVPTYEADGAALMRISPDGRHLAVVTAGFNKYNGPDGKDMPTVSGQYVFLYRLDRTGAHKVQAINIGNNFSGLVWDKRSEGLWVSGGKDDRLSHYKLTKAGLVHDGSDVLLGHKSGNGAEVEPQAAGLALSPDGKRLAVANYYNDSLSLIDVANRKVIGELDLRPGKIDAKDEGKPGGEGPLAVSFIAPDQVAISAARDREIDIVSTTDKGMKLTRRILLKGVPTAQIYDPRNHKLYVTEDNADRLAVIDTTGPNLESEPRLNLPEALGSFGKGLNPNGLFLTRGGKLLISLGGINAVGVMDTRHADQGLAAVIPTGWYPSDIAQSPDGKSIFVINRKSVPGPNPEGCQPKIATDRAQINGCGAANQYVFQLEKAGFLQFSTPTADQLAALTAQVGDNLGLKTTADRKNAEDKLAEIRTKIKHVIFVIKENRTYDQVLGDLSPGNGEAKLAILGERLSPNHHQLARQFVTLDNFYDSGEQSSTGWTWTTTGRVTDMLEKTASVNYAGRGLAYEAEGAERFVNTALPLKDRRKVNPKIPNDPDLLPGPGHVTSPDGAEDHQYGQGFLWNAALRAGLSVRNYGMANDFIYEDPAKGGVPLERDPFSKGLTVYYGTDRALIDRSDPYFRGYDQKFPDFWRVAEFNRDLDDHISKGTVANLMLVRISHDHFGDFKAAIDGVNTVETEMVDNDYALGRLVAHVANSPIAKDTLIFVIEDDAQNGVDHVDARRSIAFVAGPYVKQSALISTRYTTVNFLRTIEAVLGLKPMGLNDALASPMADVFDLSQTHWSFEARAANVLRTTQLPIKPEDFVPAPASADLCGVHTADYWAQAMAGQDFRLEDRLDTQKFNAALWQGLAVQNGQVGHDKLATPGCR